MKNSKDAMGIVRQEKLVLGGEENDIVFDPDYANLSTEIGMEPLFTLCLDGHPELTFAGSWPRDLRKLESWGQRPLDMERIGDSPYAGTLGIGPARGAILHTRLREVVLSALELKRLAELLRTQARLRGMRP